MKDVLNTLGLSGIRAFTEKCAEIEDMSFLTIGEPDFDTPDTIKDVLIQSIQKGETHYPPAIGLLDLRKAILDYENGLVSQPYTLDNVLVTIGATESLFLALSAIVEPGDEVIMPTPCFALYDTQISLLRGKTIPMPLENQNFQIRKEYLDSFVNENTRGIILATPNNPTGTVLDLESIQTLYTFLKEDKKRYVILDEVYREFIYEGAYVSLRDYEDILDQIILTQSFSKSKAMTGWRIGYVVASKPLIHAMHIVHQNLVTGVPTFIQRATIEAIGVDNTYMKESYRMRRDYVLQRLQDMGVPYVEPHGAFYIFLNISDINPDSLDFATKLAIQDKLALIPGIYFGTDNYIRLSYCYEMEVLEESLNKLEKHLKENY